MPPPPESPHSADHGLPGVLDTDDERLDERFGTGGSHLRDVGGDIDVERFRDPLGAGDDLSRLHLRLVQAVAEYGTFGHQRHTALAEEPSARAVQGEQPEAIAVLETGLERARGPIHLPPVAVVDQLDRARVAPRLAWERPVPMQGDLGVGIPDIDLGHGDVHRLVIQGRHELRVPVAVAVPRQGDVGQRVCTHGLSQVLGQRLRIVLTQQHATGAGEQAHQAQAQSSKHGRNVGNSHGESQRL